MMMVPQELATEILSCLPVKSLLRFKCACSSWYHLINSPSFVNLHLTTAKLNYNRTILTESASPAVSDLDPPSFSLVSGDTFHVIREVTLPFFGKSGFTASTPCNGLFCLIGNHHPFSHDIALWNPATRTFEILPYSSIIRTNLVIAFGFGAIRSDSDSDCDYDYKVVKIVLMSMSSFHAYVYSSKKKCWAQVAAGPPPSAEETLLHTDCHGYHNGSYYWFSLYMNSITILSFDMHSHVFDVGSLPVTLPGHLWMVNFEVRNDSIVIVMHSSKEPVRAEEMITYETGTSTIHHCYPKTIYCAVPYRGQASFRWYSVLVRDEVLKTWSYGASVKDYSFMHTRVCINGAAVGHDGEHLVSYNRETRERKRIRVYFGSGGRPFTMVPFIESLVFANGGESVPENACVNGVDSSKTEHDRL